MSKVKIIGKDTHAEAILPKLGRVVYGYGDVFETDEYNASYLVKTWSSQYALVSESTPAVKPPITGGN